MDKPKMSVNRNVVHPSLVTACVIWGIISFVASTNVLYSTTTFDHATYVYSWWCLMNSTFLFVVSLNSVSHEAIICNVISIMLASIGWFVLTETLNQLEPMITAIIVEILLVISLICSMLLLWNEQRLPTATPAVELTDAQRTIAVTAECV